MTPALQSLSLLGDKSEEPQRGTLVTGFSIDFRVVGLIESGAEWRCEEWS